MPVFTKKRPGSLRLVINQLVERVNDDAKRLRVLEQRNEAVESRLNSIEQGLAGNYKELMSYIKGLEDKTAGLEDKIRETENRIGEIIRQFKKVATKSDLKGLENMLDIYNPLKSNFVTRGELERVLKVKKV